MPQPIPITAAQYQMKFGTPPPVAAPAQPQATQAPIPITAAQYQTKFGVPPSQPKSPSVISQIAGNLKDTFKQGGQDVTKDVTDIPQNAKNAGGSMLADVAATGAAAGHIAGDVARTAGGIIGSFVSPILPKPVKDTIGDVSSYIDNKISQIPGMTPDIHKSLGDVFNTLTLEGGAKGEPVVTQPVVDAAKAVGETATSVVNDVGEAASKLTDKLPNINPSPAEIIAKRQSTLGDLANKYTSVDNAVQKATARGFDPIADIASDNRFIPDINTDGKIDSSVAINNLNKYIAPIAKTERDAIVAEGKRISFDSFANTARNEISGLAERGSSYETIANKIESDLRVYKSNFVDSNGTIDLAKLDDIKNAKYSIANWNNEDAQIADKSVARAARKLIVDNSSADIQGLNQKMSQYYSARDVLDAVDGKIVKGGRLGKYFARTVGGIIGSHFGVLGAAGGAVAGDAIESAILKSKMTPIFGNAPSLETAAPDVLKKTQETLGRPKLQLPKGK